MKINRDGFLFMFKKVFCLSFFSLFLLTLAFLPSILSGNFGKKILTSYLESRLQGKVEIEELSLSWFSKQKGKNISYLLNQDKVFYFQNLSIESSFWGLIKGERSFKLREGEGKIGLVEFRSLTFDYKKEKSALLPSCKATGNTQKETLLGQFSIQTKDNKGSAQIENFPCEGLDSLFSLKDENFFQETFGDALNIDSNIESEHTHITLRSPRFFGDFTLSCIDNLISIKKKNHFTWLINKKPFIWATENLPISLEDSTKIEVELLSGSIPIKNQKFLFEELEIEGNLLLSKGIFSSSEIKGKVFSNQLKVAFKSPKLQEITHLNFDHSFKYDSFLETKIKGKISIDNLMDIKKVWNLSAQVENFPIPLIDALKHTDYTHNLGSTLNCEIKSLEKETQIFQIKGSTPLLKIPSAEFIYDKKMKLLSPMLFSYNLESSSYLKLLKPALLECCLNSGSFSFSHPEGDLDIKTDQVLLDEGTLSSIDAKIKIKDFNSISLNSKGTFHFSDKIFFIESPIEFTANMELINELPSFKFQFKHNHLKTDLCFNIKNNEMLLTKPCSYSFSLPKVDALPFNNTPLMHVTIKEATIPIKGPHLIMIKGHGKIPSLEIDSKTLKNTHIDFNIDRKKETHHFHLETAEKGGGKAELDIEGESTLLNCSKGFLKLEQISSEIIDSFFKTHSRCSDIIGPFLNLNCNLKKNAEMHELDLVMNSPHLDCSGSFLIGDFFELKSPLKIDLNLTEKGGLALSPYLPYAIKDTARIKADCLSLKIATNTFNISDSLFDLSLEIDHLKSDKDSEIENFCLQLSKEAKTNLLNFELEGSAIEAQKRGSIQGNGSIDLLGKSASIHATSKDFPTLLIDPLLGNPYSSFLGSVVSGSFDTEIKNNQGTLDLNITGPSLYLDVSSLVKNGIIYLKKPLSGTFEITEKLNAFLSKKFSLEILDPNHPLSFFIDKKGFSLPLLDFHLKNLIIPYGQVNLDQIVCRHTSDTFDISSLLNVQLEANIPFWVAPLEFSLKQGRMKIERTEVLLNHALHLAIWGDLDNIILGITDSKSQDLLAVPIKSLQKKPTSSDLIQNLKSIFDHQKDRSKISPPNRPYPWEERN